MQSVEYDLAGKASGRKEHSSVREPSSRSFITLAFGLRSTIAGLSSAGVAIMKVLTKTIEGSPKLYCQLTALPKTMMLWVGSSAETTRLADAWACGMPANDVCLHMLGLEDLSLLMMKHRAQDHRLRPLSFALPTLTPRRVSLLIWVGNHRLSASQCILC